MPHKKKIFDITPPVISQKEKFLPRPKPKGKIMKRMGRGPMLIGGGIILIAILGFVFIKAKAEIEIWPEKELVDFETEGLIPGEIFQAEKSISQEFSSTGIKSKAARAHGIIRIYNAYSTYSQTLVATTRFVSDDGKLFRTPKRVIIPGGHYEGGKLVPGSIDITVEAGEAGEEYNIGPATFSIPGFAGTDRYTSFYAKSFEPMTGGQKTEVSQVTQEDLDKAQEILSKRALEESRLSLENTIPSEYIIVEGAVSQELTEITTLSEEGQEIEKFLFQVKAEAKALAFKKLDLEEFAKIYIRSQILQQKELQENTLNIEYTPASIDLERSEITLDLVINAEIYSTIDETSLKETIKNKTPDEISEVLGSFPEINKARVRLWPFWTTKAPQDIERIEIRLNFD